MSAPDRKRQADRQWFRFASEKLVFASTLVCPVGVLWRHYLAWCEEEIERPMDAERFDLYLEASGVEMRSGGRGLRRRVAEGVGCIARTRTDGA